MVVRSHSFETTPSTIFLFIRSVIISTPASPAPSTITDTKPDSPAAFPIFILLIGTLIMCLPIKRGTLLTLSA